MRDGSNTAMLDGPLRPAKDRLLGPLTRGPLRAVPPIVMSVLALVAALGAAAAAWQQLAVAAVALWLISRIADGLDGALARHQDVASDAGGLIDIVFDTVGYAAIPLGIAAGIDTRAAWIIVAVLLATFYINAVSWTYLAALLEKRNAGAATIGASTSTVMPRGLVEGTETIVFFAVALAWQDAAVAVLAIMAAAVAITIAERMWWARGVLA
jgi:phosphatidylglycerophosphate synthase